MLEKLVLEKELSKEEYKSRLPGLEWELFDLERRAKAAKIPTVIVFEGFEAAGKGTAIQTFTERLDPRAIRIHPIHDPAAHELGRPWMWRFWMRLPNDGEIAIFDTSWYRHILQERMAGKVKRREWDEASDEINEFEHQLADDGHVMIKFWLHISKKEQKRRLERAEKDATAFFHVTKDMWRQNKAYEKWLAAVEEMLERTETEWAPWTIIESHDRRAARVKIIETVVKRLGERVSEVQGAPPPLPRPERLGGQAKGAAAPAAGPAAETPAAAPAKAAASAASAQAAPAKAGGGDGRSAEKAAASTTAAATGAAKPK
jgi:polyphosphate kinase 2 (PPK2 family)